MLEWQRVNLLELIGTAAARFHFVGEDWLNMNYRKLKFWHDLAVEMYKAEKRTVENLNRG